MVVSRGGTKAHQIRQVIGVLKSDPIYPTGLSAKVPEYKLKVYFIFSIQFFVCVFVASKF